MKKWLSKLFSLALVCVLFSSLATSASAVQIREDGYMFGIKVARINDMQTTINSPGKTVCRLRTSKYRNCICYWQSETFYYFW